MDTSVIIVNYCTAGLVAAAVESVVRLTQGVSYEVLIVDNASPDGSGAELQTRYAADEKVKVIQSEVNLGFGGANNLGFSQSQGRNVLMLNPDTVLLNDAVSLMSLYLDDNEDVGLCGGNLFTSQGQPASSFKRLFPSVGAELSSLLCHLPEKLRYGRNVTFNHTRHALDVAFIVGADLMIRRSLAEELGLFDTAFFMYYEETDLCRRVKDMGYAVRSVPGARICHLEGKSISNLERKAEMNFNSRSIYMKKHHGSAYVALCDFIFRMSVGLRLFVLTLSGGNKAYWGTMKKMFDKR